MPVIDRLDFVTLKDGTGPVMAVIGGARSSKTMQYTHVTLTWFDGNDRRLQSFVVSDVVHTLDQPSEPLKSFLAELQTR